MSGECIVAIRALQKAMSSSSGGGGCIPFHGEGNGTTWLHSCEGQLAMIYGIQYVILFFLLAGIVFTAYLLFFSKGGRK